MSFDRKTYLRSWRERHRAEIRDYKHHPNGHRCPCGQPAIEWKSGWRCARCQKWEEPYWNKRP